jgi:hypothetical protein
VQTDAQVSRAWMILVNKTLVTVDKQLAEQEGIVFGFKP